VTPRERWEAVMRVERPDRVPCDYWGTDEITCRLKQDLGCRTDRALWERLGVDKLVQLVPTPRQPKTPAPPALTRFQRDKDLVSVSGSVYTADCLRARYE
jgi:hypothetical protein